VYQLKITLRDIKPPVWRRIEVPGATRLDHLHLVIQAAMGWDNDHLHDFTVGGATYGIPDDFSGMDSGDEAEYCLCDVVRRAKQKMCYTYDFGDTWKHDIVVEKIAPPDEGAEYPRCTAGAPACPPEDVGGTWGYLNFVDAIGDPTHDEHEDLLEWVGGKFDPEAFDLQRTDKAVKSCRRMQQDLQ
jgi:hypothetical protein